MSFRNKKVKLPKSLIKCWNNGWILGVVQFGSSLYLKESQDIDIAIIIRVGCYEKLVKRINNNEFKGFDVSLIKEEELADWKKFRFGSHGIHLIPPLKSGLTLLGANPFLKAPNFKKSLIKKSIIIRLADYIYIVRKSVFNSKLKNQVKSRWDKFARLAIFLLDDEIKFPDVLKLRNNEIAFLLRKNKLNSDIDSKNLVVSYEKLWQKIIKANYAYL